MAESLSIYGAKYENFIAPCHKIWIMQGDVQVVGYLGEGTSKEVVANWDTPFADSSLAAKYAKANGLTQIFLTDISLQSTLNTMQVWTGNQPYTFNLVMKFRAIKDPKIEVEDAIHALEVMMAPDPVAHGVAMRTPQPVTIDFGRRQILMECCIKSLSVPWDKEKNSEGYLIRADVALLVETMKTVTQTDLKNSYK